MKIRDCAFKHPDPYNPPEHCLICRWATTTHKALYGYDTNQAPWQVRPRRSVRHCSSRDVWDWKVTYGAITEGDSCKKREDAKRDADAAMPVQVDHGGGGIGDGLLGLLATSAMVEPVDYRVGEVAGPFVALFTGWDCLGTSPKIHCEDTGSGAKQINLGYEDENRDKYPVPRWERYCRNIGVKGPTLVKLREPERIKALGEQWKCSILLCPFSTAVTREWSTQHWITLERMLFERGHRAVWLLDEDEPAFPRERLINPTAAEMAGAMLNAACVVSTDTGPPHLSGILGVPTIVLGGSTPVEKIFGAYPRVKCLQGELSCSGCGGGTGIEGVDMIDDRCHASCSNLQSIDPSLVLSEVDRVVLWDRLADRRSLVSHDRLAVIRDNVRITNHTPGALAEVGVFRGGTAKVIRHYAGDGRLLLFDTFAGVPEGESGGHAAGDFACPVDEVRSFVGDQFTEYRIGRFPDTVPDDETRFRFVHLDGDTYRTTADALDWFTPRMSRGGVIVLDDYGWWMCPGVQRAIHERFADSRIETPARHQCLVRF